MDTLTTLYRPVGKAELRLIEQSGYTVFPPRLPHQPIFYPVLTESYAIFIAQQWNTQDRASEYAGYVTRFSLLSEYLRNYPVQKVGGHDALELWVPAEDLDAFNKEIVGRIEVIHTFLPTQPAWT